MSEGASSESFERYPPGTTAPTAAARSAEQQRAIDERMAKMNAAREAWMQKPKDERDRIVAERQATKRAKQQEREAKQAAKDARRRGGAPPPATDTAPPTVRSRRATELPPTTDDLDIPRRGSSDIRGLLDLCSALQNLGDGSCFIQVTRVKPTMAYNVPCGGTQKPIWHPTDDAEFQQIYGGAEYSLRGYLIKNDRSRAITEPIAYRVSGPPNLESALTEEDTMRLNPAPNGHPAAQLRRPGLPPQAAEADMHRENLRHRETMDDRERKARQEARREREEQENTRQQGSLDVARLIAEQKKDEMERLEAAHERELNLAQSRTSGSSEMLELFKTLRPGDETKALHAQHSAEIRQLTEGHRAEIQRLSDAHATELRRLADQNLTALQRVEDSARLERDKADKLIRDSDLRTAETIREAERRAGERVTDVREQARGAYEDLRIRSEERLKDQNEQWRQRFEDAKMAHERELKRKDDEIVLMRTGIEGNMSVILQSKDSEMKRLKGERDEARDLAEKNKDWLSKMSEFEQTAEKMGFQKGSEGEGADEDLKTTVIKTGLNMATRLPEIITSLADGAAKLRNPGVPPDVARSQARSGMVRESMRTMPRTLAQPQPVHLQPLAFATEDGGFIAAPEQAPTRANRPQPLPPLEAATMATNPQQMPDLPQAAAEPQTQPQAPPLQPLPQAAPAPMPSPQPQPPPVAAASAPPPPQGVQALDEQSQLILQQFTPTLAEAFQQKASPEEVARQMIAANDADTVRVVLSMVKVEQVLATVVQNPGAYAGLATRTGQKFLRDVWRAAEQAVAQ